MTVYIEKTNLTDFLFDLAKNVMSDEGVRVMHASGARTPEAVVSLLRNFPTAGQLANVSAPKVSNFAFQRGGAALQAAVGDQAEVVARQLSRHAVDRPSGYGALAPPLSVWQVARSVPWPPPPPAQVVTVAGNVAPTYPPGAMESPSGTLTGGVIDTRGCLPWPVRDQGRRGTCVSFGTTALREQLECELEHALKDFSEQFLYWDIKTNSPDPQKTSDGTWIEFAFESLGRAGICAEGLWPYNGTIIAGNVSQAAPGSPSASALADAPLNKHAAAVYQRTTVSTGCAQVILNHLHTSGRPVAISVPVFSDPAVPQSDNWATALGFSYGYVLDPPPTSVVSGGHCVCVTGFAPDASEPLGGYFVIRNSWSTQWGSLLPAAGYYGPEAGYGQISASYVDQYLWEFGQL